MFRTLLFSLIFLVVIELDGDRRFAHSKKVTDRMIDKYSEHKELYSSTSDIQLSLTTTAEELLSSTTDTQGLYSSTSVSDSDYDYILTSEKTTESGSSTSNYYDEDIYLNNLNCMPGKVEDVKIYIQNNTIKANWSKPDAKECGTYRVLVNGKELLNTNTSNVETAYNAVKCTTLDMALVSSKNTVGNVTTRAVPGLVQDVKATFNANNITLSWRPPEDVTCVTGYMVQLNEETPVEKGSEDTEHTFNEVEACTQYMVGVAAYSSPDTGQYTTITSKTDTPSPIGQVQSMTLKITNDTLTASWAPPYLQSACISGYSIIMWNQAGTTVDYTTQDTFYDFSPLVPCMTYNVMVKAKIGSNEGVSDTREETMDAAETNPPTVSSVVTDETSGKINLRMDSKSTNMCEISKIIVNCTAEGNEPYDWIVTERHVEQTHSDNTRQATVIVDELSEFTNYVCYAYVLNTAGTSDRSEAIEFQTSEEVPSMPENLSYLQDEEGILITWDAPSKIPGIQGNYSVLIVPRSALHYIPEGCSVSSNGISDETDELRYNFYDFLPSYSYDVLIAASTGAGFGDAAALNMSTQPGVSEPPRNVEYSFENVLADIYTVSLIVTWWQPCNTNGELSHFQWNLTGQSLENGDEFNVSSREDSKSPDDDEYELNISDIRQSYNYTFTLAAYVDDDIPGEEYSFTFQSPDGYASAPESLRAESITANSAEILWEEPLEKNGEIKSYRVKIATTGPNHYVPAENCELNYENSVEITVESDVFNYSVEALPNFHYKVSVAAETGAGYGFEESIEFDTLQAVSEPPRNAIYNLENVLGETYNVSMVVAWSSPCNTNGDLIDFVWTLEGVLLDTDDYYNDTGTVQPNQSSDGDNYYMKISGILPMARYTFTLSARNSLGEGESYVVSFTSPDGYASAVSLTVEDVTAYYATILWNEPSNKNGEIQSYHVVITTEGPLHYLPDIGCDFQYDEVAYDDKLSPTTFNYTLEAFPNFKYTVKVTAVNGAGSGYENSVDFTTSEAQSEPPRDVVPSLENVLGEVYNLSLTIEWKLPCNTNGNFTDFEWILIGVSLETGVSSEDTEFVKPNELLDNTTYGLRLSGLSPMTNYTLALNARNRQGEGENYIWNFVSPDGYASPVDLSVEDISAYSANIVWHEPLNKNGEILAYRIIIKTSGPLHYIPTTCSFEYDEIVLNSTLSPTILDYSLEGFPNFKYTVTVVPINNAGYGYESSVGFNTLQAQSEAPRIVSHSMNNPAGDTYNVSYTISWLLPCNTNGILSHFVWTLMGQSLEDNSIHNETGIILISGDGSYETTVYGLRPYHDYNLSLAAALVDEDEASGEKYTLNFVSPDGYPSAPANLRVESITPYSGIILWDEPLNKNGIIWEYSLIVLTDGPLYTPPESCIIDFETNHSTILYSTTYSYEFNGLSNFNYVVYVAASTRAHYGPNSTVTFDTLADAPEAVQNIQRDITDTKTEVYQSYVNIFFDRSCALHGNFSHYAVYIYGEREGFDKVEHIFNITDYTTNQFSINLSPQFIYRGQIDVFTDSRHSSVNIDEFMAPAGVPAPSTAEPQTPAVTTTTARIILNDQIFSNNQGDIKYYAIIINIGSDISEDLGGKFDFWDAWPFSGFWSSTLDEHEYQTTPLYWNPFNNNTSRNANYTYIIGENNCTAHTNTYCNGPLHSNTQYALRIRGFTETAYRDTKLVYFVTASGRSYLAMILGLVFGILAAILLLIFIFIIWRRRKKENTDSTETITVVQPIKPPLIPKNKFIEHCEMFEENRNELKAEYSHLDRISAAEKPSSNVAMADNNKRKNRYMNIMAYDETRVKLTTDNNDNYEDYINASYIKGYSGNSEYIATQGPLESTLEDFWRMIIQEDVGIIVMVAQFVEQSKQKCYKYFPEKEEIMTVGKDINIKCISEANLNEYITRTLIVEKDEEQKTIKHLQFMLWPDFGCPTTTHSMLEFRDVMRKHIETTKNKAVIHCSAGVGRTGTLIAIDILLQKIDNSDDDIDVFGTVLDLRKQRTHMVQTEKQYEYIHKCLRDYLIKPKQTSDEYNLSPIYENVTILNGHTEIKRHDENNISTESLIRLKEL